MSELPEGFIPHDGGPCPVPLDTMVFSRHRSGVISRQSYPAKWSDEWGRWNWSGTPYDGWNDNITAYRIAPTIKQSSIVQSEPDNA